MDRFRKSVAWYIYDGLVGRLVAIAERPAITYVGDRADEDYVAFFPNGFVAVVDRRGQLFKLKTPVVVEETTISGNGGYTTVTTRWYDGADWRSSRHFADAGAVAHHLAAVGFALRWDSDRGEHRVLTRFGERSVTHGVITAVTSPLVTSW